MKNKILIGSLIVTTLLMMSTGHSLKCFILPSSTQDVHEFYNENKYAIYVPTDPTNHLVGCNYANYYCHYFTNMPDCMIDFDRYFLIVSKAVCRYSELMPLCPLEWQPQNW